LWLTETSQQPISQTTWLKVTPNCNHCNHYTWEHVHASRRTSQPCLENLWPSGGANLQHARCAWELGVRVPPVNRTRFFSPVNFSWTNKAGNKQGNKQASSKTAPIIQLLLSS
jgi:hypothetical protein